jgi:hypothetical protein
MITLPVKKFGFEVVAMVFKHRNKPKPQSKQDLENEKFLRQIWQYENHARQLEGLPPISWEAWLSWYKWRQKQAQQGGSL